MNHHARVRALEARHPPGILVSVIVATDGTAAIVNGEVMTMRAYRRRYPPGTVLSERWTVLDGAEPQDDQLPASVPMARPRVKP